MTLRARTRRSLISLSYAMCFWFGTNGCAKSASEPVAAGQPGSTSRASNAPSVVTIGGEPKTAAGKPKAAALAGGTSGEAPDPAHAADAAQEKKPFALSLQHPAEPLPTPPPQDYATWRGKKRIWVGKSHLFMARLAPDQQTALTMSEMEQALRIYDIKNGRLRFKHPLADYDLRGAADAVFWPDSSAGLLLLVGAKDGLTLRKADTFDVQERFSKEPVGKLEWSADRRILVTAQAFISKQKSRLSFYRRSGQQLEHLASFETQERVDGFAISADNQHWAATYYPSNRVEFGNLGNGEVLWSLPAPPYAGAVAIAPDAKTVAVGGSELRLIDAHNPERQASYQGFKNNVHDIVFSPSGDAVFVSAYDGRIRIFANSTSTPQLQLLRELRHGGTANVYQLALSPQGSLLLSASGDQTLRVWGP